jgi:hypothetical protein
MRDRQIGERGLQILIASEPHISKSGSVRELFTIDSFIYVSYQKRMVGDTHIRVVKYSFGDVRVDA